MATPETGRQFRQQRADIDSFYELVSTVDQKLTNLTGEVAEVRREMTAGFTDVRREMTGEVAEVRREMTAGFTDVRREMTAGFTEVHSALARILERLDR